MIEIPTNKVQENDTESVVAEVMKQLTTGKDKYGEGAIGTAYIDWGIVDDTYQNCPSKSTADKVANTFKEKGYYVYVQCMGRGNKRITEGTPICYRIFKEARKYDNWKEL